MSAITTYVNTIEQDYFQTPGAIAGLLHQASQDLREQALQVMRIMASADDYDNSLKVIDEIIFYSQGAPEALLVRAQYLLADEQPEPARKDLERVLKRGSEEERERARGLLRRIGNV